MTAETTALRRKIAHGLRKFAVIVIPDGLFVDISFGTVDALLLDLKPQGKCKECGECTLPLSGIKRTCRREKHGGRRGVLRKNGRFGFGSPWLCPGNGARGRHSRLWKSFDRSYADRTAGKTGKRDSGKGGRKDGRSNGRKGTVKDVVKDIPENAGLCISGVPPRAGRPQNRCRLP